VDCQRLVFHNAILIIPFQQYIRYTNVSANANIINILLETDNPMLEIVLVLLVHIQFSLLMFQMSVLSSATKCIITLKTILIFV